MSAESKKKRGESGASKGKTAPFRLNGIPADHMVKKLRGVPADHHGTHMVRGAIGGLLAAKLGYGFTPSQRLASLVDLSLEHCPAAQEIFDTL